MSWVKELRDRFGFSQELLASFVDLPRSSMAMAETQGRILPTAALLKLVMIEKISQQDSNEASIKKNNVVNAKVLQKFQQQLQYEINDLQYEAHQLHQKLYTKQKKQAQALQQVKLVELLMLDNNLSEKDKAWANLVEMISRSTLEKNHEGEQALLQIKINAIEEQAEEMRKLQVPQLLQNGKP
jgi:DNA-binding XRE family transcriptional regulator